MQWAKNPTLPLLELKRVQAHTPPPLNVEPKIIKSKYKSIGILVIHPVKGYASQSIAD